MHDIIYLIAAAVLGTVSVVAWQLYPPGFEAVVLRDILDTKCRTSDHQRGQIAALKAVQDVQEKRILRLEIDNTRKQRMLLARGQEIEMLENIVRVAVTGLRTDGGARPKVDNQLSELAKFRCRAQDQQDEWEQTQSSMYMYEVRLPESADLPARGSLDMAMADAATYPRSCLATPPSRKGEELGDVDLADHGYETPYEDVGNGLSGLGAY